MKTNIEIALGIERTGAVRYVKGYRYLAPETGEWYHVSARDLAVLGKWLSEGMPDAYSHWCAGYGRPAPRPRDD